MDRVQELRVEHVMTPAPVCLEEDCTLAGVLAFLVREHHQTAPILARDGQLAGVVTRAHLLAWLSGLLQDGGGDLTLREVMDRGIEPAIDRRPLRCSAGMRLKEASKLLLHEHAQAALVVRDGVLVGILTLRDVVRAMAYGDEHAAAGHGHGHCFTSDGLPEHACDPDQAAEEEYLLEQLLARRDRP